LKIKNLFYNFFLIILISTFKCFDAFGQYVNDKKFNDKNYLLQFNGFINLNLAGYNQNNYYQSKILPDQQTENHLNNKNFSIGNDTQLFIRSAVKHNNKKYGLISKIEFNYSSDRIKENPNLDEIFLFSENEFGKFEIGNSIPVNQKMKYGPAKFARGAGGINGKYLQYINFPMLNNSSQFNNQNCGNLSSSNCSMIKLPSFLTLAQSPIGHGGYAKSFYGNLVNPNSLTQQNLYGSIQKNSFRALKDDSYEGLEDSTKISYYSNRIKGFQIGLSYSPSSSNNNITANTAKDFDRNINLKNIFGFGINYLEDFENLGIAIYSTAEKANIKNSSLNNQPSRYDLMAYDLGFTISYFGFKTGFSYGNWLNSLQPKNGIYSCNYSSELNLNSQNCQNQNKKFQHPYYYSTGLSYQFGPINTSITTLYTKFQKNRYQVYSFGLDYKYSKNLLPYLEISKFSFNVNQPVANDLIKQENLANINKQISNNQGYVLLLGILYSF